MSRLKTASKAHRSFVRSRMAMLGSVTVSGVMCGFDGGKRAAWASRKAGFAEERGLWKREQRRGGAVELCRSFCGEDWRSKL